MKVRFIIIDEPIHVYEEEALVLWRKALWAKELGYRGEYSSDILPVGKDDFIATHLIAAEEMSDGTLEPMFMYKSITRSKAEKFKIDFPFEQLLVGTEHEHSAEVKKILSDPRDISYDSSWTINPIYKAKGKDFCRWLRELATVYGANYHQMVGIPRWITCGVTKFKIDEYFQYLGGEAVLTPFTLPIIDNDRVQIVYIDDSSKTPAPCQKIAKKYSDLWSELTIYSPTTQKASKVAA